jgi:Uma2 family endonuclease
MTQITTAMTAEELLRLSHDGTKRYELVLGELRTMAPAGFDHGMVANHLGTLLTNYVNSNHLGRVLAAETGFIVRHDPDTVRAPDSSFVSNERLKQYGRPKRGYYPHGPDLAVEVLSPDERQDDIDEKLEDWFAGGVRLVWLVNPRRKTVTVYRSLDEIRVLTERDTLDGEDVVPGFTCGVADLFV